jgi:hypothetical protein
MSRLVLLTSLGVAVLGCAAKAETMVRTRAATDFSCPEEEIKTTELTSNINIFEYTATGCEKTNQYQAKCGRYFFLCDVSSFSEIDQRNAQADAYMRRTAGCKSNSECVDKHGSGYECHDYVCTRG